MAALAAAFSVWSCGPQRQVSEISLAPEGACVVGQGPFSGCATTFCAPLSLQIVVDDRAGETKLTFSHHDVAPGGPFVDGNYTAPNAYLYLSFTERADGRIGEFQYFWANLYFENASDAGPPTRIYEQTRPHWGAQHWDRLEMTNGRFKGTLRYLITNGWLDIHSHEPTCTSGDIAGECKCSYGRFAIPTTVDVDVALPH
jgi:hypothetical protein